MIENPNTVKMKSKGLLSCQRLPFKTFERIRPTEQHIQVEVMFVLIEEEYTYVCHLLFGVLLVADT